MKKANSQQKKLAELIKIEKIKEADFTYKDLAEMLDMSVDSFYCWLNGQFSIKHEKYLMLQDWYYCRKDGNDD